MQTVEVEVDTRGTKADAGLLGRPELEQMITWETNNLYEYLKELYDHKHENMADNRYAGTCFSLCAKRVCCVL